MNLIERRRVEIKSALEQQPSSQNITIMEYMKGKYPTSNVISDLKLLKVV